MMNSRTKLIWSACFIAGFGVTYLWPNLYPSGEPHLLRLTAWELAIPLIPWTFLIYLSDYVLGAWAVYQVRDEHEFLVMTRVATITMGLCGLVFHWYPTIYPRPVYPTDLSLISKLAMAIIGTGDRPNCAFPSMHVAMTLACVWGLRRSVAKWAVPVLWFWAAAIAVSTLTTKQHYLWDVLAGVPPFLIAVAVDRYLWRRFGNRAWPSWMFFGTPGPKSTPAISLMPQRVLADQTSGSLAESPRGTGSGSSRSPGT